MQTHSMYKTIKQRSSPYARLDLWHSFPVWTSAKIKFCVLACACA